MDTSAPIVPLGASAAEALILMLDRNAEYVVVTDRGGRLRGVITPRDFTISPATAGVSVHEQIRRATTVEELRQRARRVPVMVDDLLSWGLASGKVVSVYSSVVDTIVRRTITLIFARYPELSLDAFTWLALGSNGRREAVLSSDIDSAVAFDDSARGRHRPVPGRVRGGPTRARGGAGSSGDTHGATASKPAFSRTNAEWRAAAREWMDKPEHNQGAMMTSLLVDGRPIHGDPGLPEVLKVFSDLRRHPGTMRLLLEESLSARPKSRSAARPARPPRHHRPQEARAAADRQHRPVGGARRRLGRAAHHRAPGRGRRVGDAARRAGAQPDRRVHGAAAAAAALPAHPAPARRKARRHHRPGLDVADRPQHGRRGRAGDRRRTAAHGQRGRLPARGCVDEPAPSCSYERTTSSVLPKTERSSIAAWARSACASGNV